MSKYLDYISILIEGICKFNCSFCIGKDIRKNVKPHIANDYKEFIELFGDLTQEISISGSNSDPYFLSILKHREIVKLSKEFGLKTSIHTRHTKNSKKTLEILDLYDEVALSIDENALDTLADATYIKEYADKIRFSIVITEENKHLINRDYLDKIFALTGVASFTFRPDVNSSGYSLPDFIEAMNFEVTEATISHNSLFFYYNNKYVSYWDNQIINLNVLYLWADGKVTNNLEWKKLYKL